MDLQYILKNRLRQRTNKNFVKWRFENKILKENELHHLLESFIGGKKQNDYFLAEIPKQMHKDIHYKNKLTEDEFIALFVISLEYLFDYIEKLESEIKEAQDILIQKA